MRRERRVFRPSPRLLPRPFITRLGRRADLRFHSEYSAHDYPFSHRDIRTYEDYVEAVESKWAFLLRESDAPVWIGEFGTCWEPRCLDSSL
jgi:hypothetical protein